jgi:nicotinamide mononucleotide transporter
VLEHLLAWARPALSPLFTLWGSPVTLLELAAFVVALAMVAANMRVHWVAWPLAIASSLAYALLFADARLYGEAGLQFVFIAVALWGWWQWLRGTGSDGRPLQVHRLRPRQIVIAALATAAGWVLLAQLLEHATDSDVPWFDALPTVASLTGQLLLARKCIENWPTWLFVNLVSVALFAHKALWLTAILYALFAMLSVLGWWAWKRRLAATHAEAGTGVGA